MIRRFTCFGVNSLCRLAYRNEYRSFSGMLYAQDTDKSRQSVKKVQERKLLQILGANQSCEFGRHHDFNRLKSVEDFQSKVPLSVYGDYEEAIGKIKAGKQNVLTEEDVLLLQPSAGSTAAVKLIPYTKSLKAEFQKGIRPWIHDLYRNVPEIQWGRSYWSVTPAATGNKNSGGGITVGFEDDKAYFGSWESRLFDLIFAVPGAVARVNSMEEFYYQTALALLDCPDLTLISIWNPSFLLLLLEYMENNSGRLVQGIAVRHKRRGAEVQRILREKDYGKLWTRLKVISCWADANARACAEKLQRLFPGVKIQGKGLLATEGFISFPLVGHDGAALSLKSHFFEFQSIDDRKIRLAHELLPGRDYAVIMTTSGGLYRYQLRDIVTVTGFAGAIPLVKFAGKQDKVSDLFGEKLNERFVETALERAGLSGDFRMLAPETDHYVLYVRFNGGFGRFGDEERLSLAENIEAKLRENFHYDYCRRLGQLKRLRIFQLTGSPDGEYLNECVKRGQRLGDVKPAALHLQSGWHHVFQGQYL
jgi:hypothetical protein